MCWFLSEEAKDNEVCDYDFYGMGIIGALYYIQMKQPCLV
jgi:hypothetical protein